VGRNRSSGRCICFAAIAAWATACEAETSGLDPGESGEAPIADAGPDQRVGVGARVELDGTASRDPDGEIVEYTWLQSGGAPVSLEPISDGRVVFVAPLMAATLDFTLLVTDAGGGVGRDVVRVEVISDSTPTADAGPDLEAAVDTIVQLDGTGSRDEDGDPLTFNWEQVRGIIVELDDPSARTAQFTTPAQPSLLTFRLTVRDADDNRASDEVTVAVRANQSPIADAGPDVVATVGTIARVDGTGSFDPDGEIVDASWAQVEGPPAALEGANQLDASVTVPPTPGVIVLELQVTDDRGAVGVDRVLVIPAQSDPELIVDYPPRNADFEGRVSSTVVTGRASDPEGTPVEVLVNGEPAEWDEEDPTRWRARATVATPTSEIRVQAEDLAGETTEAVRTIQSQLALDAPTAGAFDAGGSRILAFDFRRGLMQIDLPSGDRRVLLSPSTLEQSAVTGAAFDASSQRIYIVGANRNIVQAIDLTAGTVDIVSSVDIGSGPNLSNPAFVQLDEDDDRLLVMNRGDRTLLAVDLATGDRTLLSGANRGSGPSLRESAFALAEVDDVVYAPDGSRGVLRVDLATGERTALGTVPFGGFDVSGMVFDPIQSRVILENGSRLVGYDPLNDEWELLVEPLGPSFDGPLVLDADGRRVFSLGQGSVSVYDLERSEAEVILERSIGAGPPIRVIENDMARDPSTGRIALTADVDFERRVVLVDPADGRRTPIGGSFPLRNTANGIAWDSSAGQLYVADVDNGVWVVDEATATRSLLAGGQYDGVTVDPATGLVYATARVGLEVELHTIDPNAGDVVTVSGPETGTGPVFRDVEDVAWDAARGRVLIRDGAEGVIAVDVSTGARRVEIGDRVPGSPSLGAGRMVVDAAADRLLADANGRILIFDLETYAWTQVGPIPRIESLHVDEAANVVFATRPRAERTSLSSWGHRSGWSGRDEARIEGRLGRRDTRYTPGLRRGRRDRIEPRAGRGRGPGPAGHSRGARRARRIEQSRSRRGHRRVRMGVIEWTGGLALVIR